MNRLVITAIAGAWLISVLSAMSVIALADEGASVDAEAASARQISDGKPDAPPEVVPEHDERGRAGESPISAGSGYAVPWYVIAGGGGTSEGGGPGNALVLTATIAQPEAGVMSGGAPGNVYSVAGGFWAGGADIGEPQPPCPGDLNGDGVVDVSDLLALLGAWGSCPTGGTPVPPCPADINGDGVVDVSDLLALLGAWGACP